MCGLDMNVNRVHISRCDDYDAKRVRAAIEDSVSTMGGFPVKSGDKVLLKPNLLTAKSPEKAVTTHPTVVSAAAEMVMDCGGIPYIGDSPSGSPGEAIWSETGMADAARRLGIKLVNFTSAGSVDVQVRGNVYYLAGPALECDLLINLPKLKTHSLTLFTGAVKNLYGCLPGFQKGNWHRRAPKADDFCQVVVDVFSCFRPRINIMDGILAMEGDGPSNGRPRKLGLIIASNNAPALDSVASAIIGFDPDEIKTTKFAEMRGLSGGGEEPIVTGVSPDAIGVKDFALPKDRYLRMIPTLAHEILGRFIWTRPEVDPDICSLCGACVENCPAKAMSENGDIPTINHKICINCYCCDEVCPDGAIRKRMSWLAKRLT